MTRMRAVFEGDTHLGRTLGQGLAFEGIFKFSFINRDRCSAVDFSVCEMAPQGEEEETRQLSTRKRGREKSRLAWLAGMAAGWLAPEIYDCLPFFSCATPNSGPPGRGRGWAGMHGTAWMKRCLSFLRGMLGATIHNESFKSIIVMAIFDRKRN